MTATPGLRARLDLALRAALRARDQAAIAALRSALAAIANAEAVDVHAGSVARVASQRGPHFAGAVSGLGAADIPRRTLSESTISAIVQEEIAERQRAAAQYAAAGHSDRAERLRAEASVLKSELDDRE